jgi:hypothetical protein
MHGSMRMLASTRGWTPTFASMGIRGCAGRCPGDAPPDRRDAKEGNGGPTASETRSAMPRQREQRQRNNGFGNGNNGNGSNG